MSKIYIVGAGFFGTVLAERLAADAKLPVTLVDRRSHPGGNCWSEMDTETGVEYHKYGSHIFHTSNQEVWEYINRFTSFNAYRHSVWTTHKGRVYPLPINLATINGLYGLCLTPAQARAKIQEEASKEKGSFSPRNLEEKAVSQIGRPLYEAFIRGYTAKQWEKSPLELSADIITRLPIRYNYNIRYFSDAYEGIPTKGYGDLFKNMLKTPGIELRLNTEYTQLNSAPDDLIIYTGTIDEFFQYKLGRLEWRSIDFEVERLSCSDYQGTSVMNYADEDIPFTRIHEFKHYHPEKPDSGKSIIFREFSRFAEAGDELYYPIDTDRNNELYAGYRKLAALYSADAPTIIFGGRLGSYKYYDMDDAILAALKCYREQVRPLLGVRG
jgi:UDP-galactopyranose mutase